MSSHGNTQSADPKLPVWTVIRPTSSWCFSSPPINEPSGLSVHCNLPSLYWASYPSDHSVITSQKGGGRVLPDTLQDVFSALSSVDFKP